MEANYLWEKLGTQIQQGLQDDNVFEIMLNPDGCLWFKHKTKGMLAIGNMNESLANSFVHALAQYENKFLNDKTPYLSLTLSDPALQIVITRHELLQQSLQLLTKQQPKHWWQWQQK